MWKWIWIEAEVVLFVVEGRRAARCEEVLKYTEGRSQRKELRWVATVLPPEQGCHISSLSLPFQRHFYGLNSIATVDSLPDVAATDFHSHSILGVAHEGEGRIQADPMQVGQARCDSKMPCEIVCRSLMTGRCPIM